ncbi:MAG: hypothetical protein SGILL_000595 [Bacillariaceae sp.]
MAALQLNFGDSSRASGFVFDEEMKVLYMTGQVGPSSCFVGVLKQISSEAENSLLLLSKQVFDESGVCQSLALQPEESASLLLLSTQEEGGLLTETRPKGSNKSKQYGSMVELQFSADGTTSEYHTTRSVLLHQNQVQIPKTVVVSGNKAFIAAMTSDNPNLREEFPLEGMPDLTPGGDLKYGSNYAMTIEMVRLSGSDTSSTTDTQPATTQWRKPFGVANDDSNQGITVTQMMHVEDNSANNDDDDSLVIAGYTNGSGYAVGQAPDQVEAGFLSKLDATTGSLGMAKRYHFRINQQNMPTQIEAICDDPSDVNALYAVGSYVDVTSNGINSTAAQVNKRIPFVTKFSVENFQVDWERPFEATTHAFALNCGVSTPTAVTSTGNSNAALYVSGVVQNGGELMGQTTTHLQDDVFAMQLSTVDGSATWMTQLGTSGNDRLARGGKGMIVLENHSNGVLLMGDTTGNLYSTASSQSVEVFVVRVDAEGNSPDTSEVSAFDYSRDAAAVAVSAPVKIAPLSAPTQPPVSVPTFRPTTRPPLDPNENDTGGGGGGDNDNIPDTLKSSVVVEQLYFMMAIVLLIVLGCFCFVCFKRRQKEKNTERALVFSYLQAFEVEDIDVRHSAMGGWHGTYVGKLAKGEGDAFDDTDSVNIESYSDNDDAIDRRSQASSDGDGSSHDGSGSLLSSFSHSSIVKDSLFVDYDSKPALGNMAPYSDSPPCSSSSGGGSGGNRRPSSYSDKRPSYTDEPPPSVSRRRSSRRSTSSFLSTGSSEGDNDSFSRALAGDDFNLARLSKAASPQAQQAATDQWGTEIV